MNLRDIPSWKLHENRFPLLSLVWRHDDLHAPCLGLGECVGKIRHFIAGHFPAVRIRKMPVGDEHGELSKLRFNPYPAIRVSRSPDFRARSMPIVRGYSAVRERKKVANEFVCFVSRDIDAIFRYRLERRVGWRGGVPVELRIDAAGPLDDGVPPNRVIEGSHEDIRTRRTNCTDSRIQVGDQIASALETKRIGNGRLETKDGYAADRSENQLRHGAARGGSYGEDALLGRCAPKCSDQACDETVKILGRHVDVRRIVLRSNGYIRCCRNGLRGDGECMPPTRQAAACNKHYDPDKRRRERSISFHRNFPLVLMAARHNAQGASY